jgi:hypothetical protein
MNIVLDEAVNLLTVFVVDDDAAIRDSISLALSLRGYQLRQFASAEDFLNAAEDSWVGCVVADIRMPGISGLQLQDELIKRDCLLPVVIITGHGDVNSACQAFRNSALDFLEKPFDFNQLINAVENAFKKERERIKSMTEKRKWESQFLLLSPREREVVGYLTRGLHAKEIGEQLGISHRTVEVHKAHIMEKLGARNVIDILRMGEKTSSVVEG